ncbi:MAG: hypothetical protein ACREQN_16220 [Candidatus Binataceae bacterium]
MAVKIAGYGVAPPWKFVRSTNPARRLYERCGFVVVAEVTNRVGGSSFVMTAQLR